MILLFYIGGLFWTFGFGFVLCALIQAEPPRMEVHYEFTREDLEFLAEAHISDEQENVPRERSLMWFE